MRLLRTVLSVVLLAAPVAGGGLALLHSDWFAVADVGVDGTQRLDREDVRNAIGVPPGMPLGAVEVDRVRRTVAAMPEVADVTVMRQWPDRLAVTLTERVAVGAVDDREPGVLLVDASGFGFAREPAPPRGVPLLEVPDPGPGDAATAAALGVVQSLPEELSDQVAAVEAPDPATVQRVLADGARVLWGSTERAGTKVGALLALLPTEAAEYDVRAPDVAVTRG
jgi:cell division protein FtsQ